MYRTLLGAVVTAASLTIFSTTPAEAAPRENTYEVRIFYGDLNLNHDAGADALLNRFRRAARSVCDQGSIRETLQQHRRAGACASDFVARAVSQVDHPVVSARYRGRNRAFAAR